MGGIGPADVIAFPNLYQVFDSQPQLGFDGSAAANSILSSLEDWAKSGAHNALSEEALLEIYKIQAGLIVDDKGVQELLMCRKM